MSDSKTKNDWQTIIDEQIQSGLSKLKFCQQKGISTSRFYYYLNLLRPDLKKEPAKVITPKLSNPLVPINVKDPVISETNCDIRLVLKNGLECILPSYFDNKRLKEIIEVLMSC